MAIFSNKIEQVRFIDENMSTIRVDWNDENNTRRGHVFENAPGPDLDALLEEGWTQERIATVTHQRRAQDSTGFRKVVNDEVAAQVDAILKKYQIENYRKLYDKNDEQAVAVDHSLVWKTIEEINDNKDDLFSFKLWAIESKFGENATKEQKKELRRCTSILQGLSILYSMQG